MLTFITTAVWLAIGLLRVLLSDVHVVYDEVLVRCQFPPCSILRMFHREECPRDEILVLCLREARVPVAYHLLQDFA